MTKQEKERRKLVAGVREMVGLLSAEQLADLIEHIKLIIRTEYARFVVTEDIDSARAFLLETAIEMYLADGHPRERAEGMAHDLLQSEVVDLFGGREMLVTDDTTDAELSAFMRGKRVPTKLLNADIDWSSCPAVQQRPGRFGGAWTVRGTRIPVAGLIENYNSGYGPEALPMIFHGLSIEVAREIIAYAEEKR